MNKKKLIAPKLHKLLKTLYDNLHELDDSLIKYSMWDEVKIALTGNKDIYKVKINDKGYAVVMKEGVVPFKSGEKSYGLISDYGFTISIPYDYHDYDVSITLDYDTDKPITTIEGIRNFLMELLSISKKAIKFQKELCTKKKVAEEQKYALTLQLEKLL